MTFLENLRINDEIHPPLQPGQRASVKAGAGGPVSEARLALRRLQRWPGGGLRGVGRRRGRAPLGGRGKVSPSLIGEEGRQQPPVERAQRVAECARSVHNVSGEGPEREWVFRRVLIP